VFCRDARVAQERAEAAITLATEHGFAQWLGLATVLQGWALAEQGSGDEGLAQIHQGTGTYRNTGAELSLPHQRAFFAEACEKTGQIEEGLSALAEALAIINKTDARFNEAELYRLKGELILHKSEGGTSESLTPGIQHQTSIPKPRLPKRRSAILDTRDR